MWSLTTSIFVQVVLMLGCIALRGCDPSRGVATAQSPDDDDCNPIPPPRAPKCNKLCTEDYYSPVCGLQQMKGHVIYKTFSNSCQLRVYNCRNPQAGLCIKCFCVARIQSTVFFSFISLQSSNNWGRKLAPAGSKISTTNVWRVVTKSISRFVENGTLMDAGRLLMTACFGRRTVSIPTIVCAWWLSQRMCNINMILFSFSEWRLVRDGKCWIAPKTSAMWCKVNTSAIKPPETLSKHVVQIWFLGLKGRASGSRRCTLWIYFQEITIAIWLCHRFKTWVVQLHSGI